MGDHLWAGIPPRNVTKSTQPCIFLVSLNRVPALIGRVAVTLCDLI